MNIFILDEDPLAAARDLCNRHCVKMILESTQLLSTVAQLRGFEGPYKITHANHPCTKWIASHPANWAWLIKHASYMCYEYTSRYRKQHKCESLIEELESRSTTIWNGTDFKNHSDYYTEHKPFAQCMPEQYKQSNAVEAYRAYYRGEKRSFATWKSPAKTPDWFY